MAKDKKPEIKTEHVFTIPLRCEWRKTARVKRTKRCVSALKIFIIKNTRAKSVKISTKLNDTLWTGGAKNPPPRIRVKASVDSEGLASVKLPDEITLDEEKKKFLDDKKAKGKAGKDKEAGKSEGKEAEPDKKAEAKGEEAKDMPKEPEEASAEKNEEQKIEAKTEPKPEDKK